MLKQRSKGDSMMTRSISGRNVQATVRSTLTMALLFIGITSAPSVLTSNIQPLQSSAISRLIGPLENTGRLGNSMFQVASLLGIAAEYRLTPVLLEGKTMEHLRETFAVLPAAFMPKEAAAKLTWTELRSSCCCCHEPRLFNESLADQSKNVTVLAGLLLQSWKYFDFIRESILRAFAFKQATVDEARRMVDNVKLERCCETQNCLVVAVHIRRDDYVTSQWSRDHGLLVADAEYFRRAMAFLTALFPDSHLVFALISEDAAWHKLSLVENATFSQFDMIVLKAGKREVDLCFISIADHVIMSVGTFGWWGAYLNNGTVVYARDIARPGSKYAKEVEGADFMRPDWIGL